MATNPNDIVSVKWRFHTGPLDDENYDNIRSKFPMHMRREISKGTEHIYFSCYGRKEDVMVSLRGILGWEPLTLEPIPGGVW